MLSRCFPHPLFHKDPQFWGWGQRYLFRLVCIRERDDHPDDIEVNESSTGREGTGQDCSVAPGHLDTARALGHFQGHCDTCRERNNWSCACPFLTAVSTTASHYIQSGAVNTWRECSNQRMTHCLWSQNKKGFIPLHLRK